MEHPAITSALTPFGDTLLCFGGDHWFSLNRRAARIRVGEVKTNTRLVQHYSGRILPEESIYQTILCNRADIRLLPDNRRYADWAGCDMHPRWLDTNDLPAIGASGAQYARKFRPDSNVLNLLDAHCDGPGLLPPAAP